MSDTELTAADRKAWIEKWDKNRELITSIHIVVPCRPADGINVDLAIKLAIWYKEGITFSIINDSMGGFIEMTRANVANQFLETQKKGEYNSKFLLIIDSDQEPDIDLPYLLARHDMPVVGAAIPTIGHDGLPLLCVTTKCEDGERRFINSEENPSVPAKGLMNVTHIGTGAMMIRRDVLEAFTVEIGDIPFYVNEKIRASGAKTGMLWRGEDIEFCLQVREKGYDIFCDFEPVVGHRKAILLTWPDHLKDPALSVSNWKNKNTGKAISDSRNKHSGVEYGSGE